MRGLDLQQELWFCHVLVGDGISTNEAAARIELKDVECRLLPVGMKYSLVVVKCANHQASLSISSAVRGRASKLGHASSAAVGASDDPVVAKTAAYASPGHGPLVCGTIVRLFKYLICDYYSGFLSSLEALVSQLEVKRDIAAALPNDSARWNDLALLYGLDVLPAELRRLLNRGCRTWVHVVPDSRVADLEADPVEYGRAVRQKLLSCLRKALLAVDEHPTLSRMFTFTEHVHRMLLLHLLGLHGDVFKLPYVVPRDHNKKRLDKIHAFWAHHETPQYLRRTSVSLQLTAHVNNLCAKLHGVDEPAIVSLARGRVRDVTATAFSAMMGKLHLDPELDVGACLATLLATAVETLIRFAHYEEYPYKCALLAAVFNPSYRNACLEFLKAPESSLDVGFSLPLQKRALACGNEADALRFLFSGSVQEYLATTFRASAASSLPVERRHVETKKNEAPRLCHVATAGRNQMLHHFLRWREDKTRRLERAERAVSKLRFMSPTALAAEKVGEARRHPPEAQAYLQAHQAALQRELTDRRAAARLELSEARACSVPFTQEQYVKWFSDHRDTFAAKMKTATADRRMLNRRLLADVLLPEGVPRLQPCARNGPDSTLKDTASRLMRGRVGWFAVQAGLESRLVHFVFSYYHRGSTYIVDLSSMRRRGAYRLPPTFRVDQALSTLGEFAKSLSEDVVLYEVVVSVDARPEGLVISPHSETMVVSPLLRPTRKARRKPGLDAENAESDSSPSLDSDCPSVRKLSSCSDGDLPSVDTDIDSGVDVAPEDDVADAPEDAEPMSDDPTDGGDPAPVDVPDDGGPVRMSRHPPGTWKVWEGTWFYATQTPGWLDVKMHMKHPLRQPGTGMGSEWMSRSLTAYHYGELQTNPVRTLLLLRSWAIYRARLRGWAREREGRVREVSRQLEALVLDVRATDGRAEIKAPIFGEKAAHSHFHHWTPDLVLRICG